MGTGAHKTRLGQILAEEFRTQVGLADRVAELSGEHVSRQQIYFWVNGLHVADRMRPHVAEALGRNELDVFDEEGTHLPPVAPAAGAPA